MNDVRLVLSNLTPPQKRELSVVVVLVCIGVIFELVGVGSVLPVVTAFSNIEAVRAALDGTRLAAWAQSQSDADLAQAGVLLLLGIFVVKGLYLSFLAWVQSRFIYHVYEVTSQRLFSAYLHENYTFFLKSNSVTIIRNLTEEMQQYTQAVLAFVVLLSETLVVLAIAGLIVYVEPAGSLIVVAMLGIAGFVFNRLTGHRIAGWGRSRQSSEARKLLQVQQGILGVKDVRLMGAEPHFFAQYSVHNAVAAWSRRMLYFVQSLPRIMFEILAVLALTIVILVMLADGRNLAEILPTLGLFAIAAFRMMPSTNKIVASLNSLRFNSASIALIAEQLTSESADVTPRIASKPLTFDTSVELEDLSLTYEGTDIPSLKAISMHIPTGASVGIFGPSGSGKSTLVNLLLGLLTPTGGRILSDGTDISNAMESWQRRIGYVPQNIFLADDSLLRNVAFGLPDEAIDLDQFHAAIKAAHLSDFVSELPNKEQTQAGEAGIRLSGGQRQRIGIARALYRNPEILVLDEATSALDPETEASLMQAVNDLKGQITLIIVAHRHSTIASCDTLYRVEAGEIVQEGSYDELFSE